MKTFIVAVQFLTIFSWPKVPESLPAEIGGSAGVFPLVGFFLGLILLSFDRLLENILPPVILSIALVLIMVVMTRAFHLDGLGDTFDGLGARGGTEEALRAMRDSHTGIFGLSAVVAVLALKAASIEATRELRPHALMLAPVLGRWAMLVLAYRGKSIAEGLGRIVVRHMNARHLLFGTALTIVPTLIISRTLGAWILLSVFSLAICMRIWFRRRLGGITGDHCGAVEELAEALTLVIFAAAERKRFGNEWLPDL